MLNAPPRVILKTRMYHLYLKKSNKILLTELKKKSSELIGKTKIKLKQKVLEAVNDLKARGGVLKSYSKCI